MQESEYSLKMQELKKKLEMKPEEEPEVVKAVNAYLQKHGLVLPRDARFGYIIDGVYVYVEEHPVLCVGLPPVSNYPVDETEYTNKYLRAYEAVAV